MLEGFSLEKDPFYNEEFRSVIGYDGRYSISNLGRVRSERRERPNGGYLKERILKIAISNENGQCGVNLWESNIPKHFLISSLVADAFIKNSRSGKKIVVIHKNKNAKDNRLINLIVDSKSVSNKIDYKFGITYHNIQSMALAAIERGKKREQEFGIYESDILIGYICKRCFKECSFDDFSHTNTICNHCKAISEGTNDVGKIKRRNELSTVGIQECSKCNSAKPFSEFYKDRKLKNGIKSSCKQCNRKSV